MGGVLGGSSGGDSISTNPFRVGWVSGRSLASSLLCKGEEGEGVGLRGVATVSPEIDSYTGSPGFFPLADEVGGAQEEVCVGMHVSSSELSRK
jgi:hypothetical protein